MSEFGRKCGRNLLKVDGSFQKLKTLKAGQTCFPLAPWDPALPGSPSEPFQRMESYLQTAILIVDSSVSLDSTI